MTDIKTLALQCRDAATAIASLPTQAKNALLRAMADALLADEAVILAANARDIEAAAAKGIGSAMLDRLRLDTARLQGIAAAVREVAELPDPVGQVTRAYDRPNGIHVERVRVPLGVIAMIYEARPNVTADAAALCLKAGNAVILRGGSEAIHSNTAVAASLKRALRDAGLPDHLRVARDLAGDELAKLRRRAGLVGNAALVQRLGHRGGAQRLVHRRIHAAARVRQQQGAQPILFFFQGHAALKHGRSARRN